MQATVSPYQFPVATAQAPVTPTQGLDITNLMNTILPLMTLMLVFSIMVPMFRQLGTAFGGGEK